MYDSGSLLEETLRSSYPAIFNSEAEKDTKQTEQMDGRSDDKGLEVESLTLATVCGKTYAFVGAERTSTIFVFDITDPVNPSLHSHVSAAGNTDMAPDVAFAIEPQPRPNVNLGQIDPEMMSFDMERRLLIVSGAVSVTLHPFCFASCRHWLRFSVLPSLLLCLSVVPTSSILMQMSTGDAWCIQSPRVANMCSTSCTHHVDARRAF